MADRYTAATNHRPASTGSGSTATAFQAPQVGVPNVAHRSTCREVLSYSTHWAVSRPAGADCGNNHRPPTISPSAVTWIRVPIVNCGRGSVQRGLAAVRSSKRD
ncbi:hypothetical protein GCM10011608_24770 [Micromonospora sonchi]|uniref:Uncharacterized protein n=1 Tax=Micromonospora sonchi TaxID=1763543 RepID=A0A917WXN9_9ACTN|nr:hypothetical protein [Micromonospora sonchi]GGM39120.1 hypothetical protein GCM10011608_24770 [Micromonospora sonchi]